MNIQAEKIEIAKALLGVNSAIIIKHIKAVLNSYETDLWDELSNEQKASVKRAKLQLAQGGGKPHKEVMKQYTKWLTK